MPDKKHIVVLTGAGVSAESGLKTFRDSDGLWNGYDVYDVATPGAWKRNPKLVLDFYNDRRRDVAAAMPNAAHFGLAALENDFKVTIVTQNIDDLHERAGSTNIIHLHGEIFKMKSELNEAFVDEIKGDINIGDKAADGAQLRPFIVWFEEPVPLIEKAVSLMYDCDYFVVVAYGRILPQELLDIPREMCINVHGSILPAYRGASPIQGALLSGEKETGVTIMQMSL